MKVKLKSQRWEHHTPLDTINLAWGATAIAVVSIIAQIWNIGWITYVANGFLLITTTSMIASYNKYQRDKETPHDQRPE